MGRTEVRSIAYCGKNFFNSAVSIGSLAAMASICSFLKYVERTKIEGKKPHFIIKADNQH
jgi:hypothetical protein